MLSNQYFYFLLLVYFRNIDNIEINFQYLFIFYIDSHYIKLQLRIVRYILEI